MGTKSKKSGGTAANHNKKSGGVSLPLLLVIVIVVALIFFGNRNASSDDSPVENLEAAAFSANDFAAKFSANKNAANSECKNNVFEITGAFESVKGNKVLIATEIISEYSNTYDLSFELAEGQSLPEGIIPGCPVTVKGRFKWLSLHTIEFDGSIFISQGEIELFGTYNADELAHLIDENDDFAESLEGRYIQITGEVKENKLSDDEIYILGDFKYGEWYQCEMLNKLDVNDAEPGDIATIQGRVENTYGRCRMDYCKLISVEEATTEPTSEAIMTETSAPATNQIIITDPPVKNQRTYWLNTDSGKFHHGDCRTIKGKTESYWVKRTCDRKDLINQGYSPCGVCHP